jgi:hypothetical protein
MQVLGSHGVPVIDPPPAEFEDELRQVGIA